MGGEFAYQPEGAPSPTMSAVGLLCNQYLRAGKTDPVIVGGVRYLMANLPDAGSPNVYYLVLRQPGHAQHGRPRLGRLESQECARFWSKAKRGKVAPPEAGMPTNRMRRLGHARRPHHDDQPRRLTLEVYYATCRCTGPTSRSTAAGEMNYRPPFRLAVPFRDPR